jgi:RimJ/RimL family protein N-acetyltransferase
MIRLRPATLADARLLYDWRIDPQAVAMFDGPPPASYEDHVGWLRRRLSQASPALYIGSDADRDVGTVRLDQDGHAFEVSVAVAKGARGCGYGPALVRAVCREAPDLSWLIARVKHANFASQRTFLAAGFWLRDAGVGQTHVVYERLIVHRTP